jgi:hypothetical protein
MRKEVIIKVVLQKNTFLVIEKRLVKVVFRV